jgi:hypothetical protein
MDTGNPFIKKVKKNPQAKIVFDLFHVLVQLNRIIDNVRNSKYHKASKENKAVFKGPNTCCLKTAKKFVSKPSAKNLTTAGIK